MGLRSTVFQCFGCFPGHLERIFAKVLRCYAVRIQGVLGLGSYNLVLDALLYETRGEDGHRRVAIRIPLTREPLGVTQQQATSGYAATLFMSSLSLPTAVAGPVHAAAASPLPYATRGGSHLTVMPVLDGVSAWNLWRGATLAWKKTLVADVATVVLQLYRHPLEGFGNMTVSADGVPCVGPLHDGAVFVAMQRGVDVGGLSPGPYLTWKEFAWNHVQGLLLLFGESPVYGQHIKRDSQLVMQWLEKFEPRSDKFYLVHPDFQTTHAVVDAGSGHVQSIVDWDFARTGTVQSLVHCFYLYDREEEEEDEEELTRFYVEQLRQGGAPELVQYVVKELERVDPQAIFENEFCPDLPRMNLIEPSEAYRCLRNFCVAMGLTEHSPLLQPPWYSSSTEDDETTSYSSSSYPSSSSADELEVASPLVDA